MWLLVEQSVIRHSGSSGLTIRLQCIFLSDSGPLHGPYYPYCNASNLVPELSSASGLISPVRIAEIQQTPNTIHPVKI